MRRSRASTERSRTAQIVAAFAAVYVIWGSTYLAIRIGVRSEPPALFAGLRFLLAGVLMLAYAFWRGGTLPASARDWRSIAITGLLMLGGGNGLVTWAEQWIESNQAALMVASSALWLAGMGALGSRGEKVNALTVAGLLLGFGGVAVLVNIGVVHRLGPPMAYAALLAAPLCWSLGSVWARRAPVGCTPAVTSALQMLMAGAFLCGVGLATGEAARWRGETQALWVLLYLSVFGSCVAYGAYFWLVHQVPPARLGTYAYVNPAVAVLLGWWFLDEHLNRSQVAGTLIILAGVVLVTWASRVRKT
ncbi:MAG TPA: EamA family transporter [Candidatus Binatia bacterium]|nr:EamA family transporter [Candidatus Binatia bacterium]